MDGGVAECGLPSRGGACVVDVDELVGLWQGFESKRAVAVDAVGEACGLGAADEHDAPVGGEEHGGVDLRDAFGVDADVARDGLLCGVCACGGDLEGPDAVGGECVERELPELSLRERLCGGADSEYFACAYGVDSEDGEVERVVDLGGVDFVRHADGALGFGGDQRRLACLWRLFPPAEVEGPV